MSSAKSHSDEPEYDVSPPGTTSTTPAQPFASAFLSGGSGFTPINPRPAADLDRLNALADVAVQALAELNNAGAAAEHAANPPAPQDAVAGPLRASLIRRRRPAQAQALRDDPARTFVCDICGYRYLTDKQLQAHRTTVHSDEEFPCDQCDKVYTMRHSLAWHKRNKH